ncbi:hypothetical protein CVT26_014875 [Gymnopilus dilepis]|uniref:Uncharacterized protein n=1 Tax=Gymnopilus dilepis TaxID=231916 RepID=A0A409XX50_9AGAR|nr:hypothetical protein CVT26_014875 [Gymnopilus dilepis]
MIQRQLHSTSEDAAGRDYLGGRHRQPSLAVQYATTGPAVAIFIRAIDLSSQKQPNLGLPGAVHHQ